MIRKVWEINIIKRFLNYKVGSFSRHDNNAYVTINFDTDEYIDQRCVVHWLIDGENPVVDFQTIPASKTLDFIIPSQVVANAGNNYMTVATQNIDGAQDYYITTPENARFEVKENIIANADTPIQVPNSIQDLLDELDEKTEDAETINTTLTQTISDASTINTTLEDNIASATNINGTLEGNITSANNINDDLESNITTGNTLNDNLSNNITTGNTLNNDLEQNIEDGEVLKEEIETIIADGDVLQKGVGFDDVKYPFLKDVTDVVEGNAERIQNCFYENVNFSKYYNSEDISITSALQSPLYQKFGINFIGDSITWGMTTSDIGTKDPRGHELTDIRNLLTASSWVNLSSKKIAKEILGTDIYEEHIQNNGSPNPNTMLFKKNELVFPLRSDITVSNINENIEDANTVLGRMLKINALGEIVFEVYGDSFTFIYSSTAGTRGYELFIDDISQGVFTTTGSGYSNERKHIFQQGKHTIKMVVDVGTGQLRAEAFRFEREIYFGNNGLIGTNSEEWRSDYWKNLLIDVFSDYDLFTVISLGTNDRSKGRLTSHNLENIIDYCKNQNKIPLLNMVNSSKDDQSLFFYNQEDIKKQVVNTAKAKNVDISDMFTSTLQILNKSFLDDGLHPNDYGHDYMSGVFFRFVSEKQI